MQTGPIQHGWVQIMLVVTALLLWLAGALVSAKVHGLTGGGGVAANWLLAVASLLALPLGAAVVAAWLGWRWMPVLVDKPGLAVGLGLGLLLLPLYGGFIPYIQATRSVAIVCLVADEFGQYWVPGYAALLLLLPVMAWLAERLRVTGRARYAFWHLALLWLAGSLLLLQRDLAIMTLLLSGALISAVLARPRGKPLGIMVLGMPLVLGWFLVEANWEIIPDWGILHADPPLRAFLAETWRAAGWQGTGRLVLSFSGYAGEPDRYPYDALAEMRLPMSKDLVINAAAQIYGWRLVLVMVALAAWHVGGLFLLTSGITGRLYRWTAVLFASVPALMAFLGILSATGWVGWPFPTFVFPWVGSDFSSLTALAWILGAVIALAARIPPAEARAGAAAIHGPD